MEILETFPRVFCFRKSRINEKGGNNKNLLKLKLERDKIDNSAFSNFFGLKSVLKKLHFRDRLVLLGGFYCRNKAVLSISPK